MGIVGSRHFTDYPLFVSEIEKRIPRPLWPTLHIISGGAHGADELAAKFARENNCRITVHPALWKVHGMSAGPMRNSDIVRDSDQLIAFLAPSSIGTQDTIRKARAKKIPVHIINVA